jgi:L-ascorbate metabolism protein UlaG (beta-lactamase superfamily)
MSAPVHPITPIGTSESHAAVRAYPVRIGSAVSYIGHATLLVQLEGTRILTDPLLRRRVGHIRRRVPTPRPEDIEPLDAVVVSHAHHDHLDLPSLRRIARSAPVIVPRGAGAILRRRGLKQIREVGEGDRVMVGDIVVEALPALHEERRYPWGRERGALGYLLEGSSTVYFAGDTDLFPEMAELAGRVDVAALPVWGWGPRVGTGHLDPERAARALAMIRPRMAIPIHWGTMAVIGARPGDPLVAPRAFVRAAARLAPEVDVRVLKPGQRTTL